MSITTFIGLGLLVTFTDELQQILDRQKCYQELFKTRRPRQLHMLWVGGAVSGAVLCSGTAALIQVCYCLGSTLLLLF